MHLPYCPYTGIPRSLYSMLHLYISQIDSHSAEIFSRKFIGEVIFGFGLKYIFARNNYHILHPANTTFDSRVSFDSVSNKGYLTIKANDDFHRARSTEGRWLQSYFRAHTIHSGSMLLSFDWALSRKDTIPASSSCAG